MKVWKGLAEYSDSNRLDPENPGEIGIDGTIEYIQDLGLELEDPLVLAIAHLLRSPRVGCFPKSLFLLGWLKAG